MDISNNSVLNNVFTSGYISGFISTLTFHQIAVTVFWQVGLIGVAPYSLEETQPFGIPAVLSLALWGGVWGGLYKLMVSLHPKINTYWMILAATLLPTIIFIIVIAPLKGIPFSTFTVKLTSIAIVINFAWALGTAYLSQCLTKIGQEKLAQT